jgi:hydroxypyruvate isomerase
MKLSGCLDSLFLRECRTYEDRIRACARAGLEAIEFWLWRDKDLDAIERALGETGVKLVLFSTEPRSPIVDPATHRTFIDGLRGSAVVARRLGAQGLSVLVDDRGVSGGNVQRTDIPAAEQRNAIVTALKIAGPIAADHGLQLLVEPLNSKLDHVGYFLDRTDAGLDIIEEVDHPSVLLLHDMYHAAMMAERPGDVLGDRASLVGHVHVADMPGRHEPGSGTIDWKAAIAALRRRGYSGTIGLEYWPTGSTGDSLELTRERLGIAKAAI